MSVTLQELGELVKAHREERGESQDEVARNLSPATNRSVVAHLEQGLRIPSSAVLQGICAHLGVPRRYWEPFLDDSYQKRLAFEGALSELSGRIVSLRFHDDAAVHAAQEHVGRLFSRDLTDEQTFDAFSTALIFYGVRPPSVSFFKRYLGPNAFKSVDAFADAVRKYQVDAIRLYSTFMEAYERLNTVSDVRVELEPLSVHTEDSYRRRTPWSVIEIIGNEQLPDLGYISAAQIRKEHEERQALSRFLRDLAVKVRAEGKNAINDVSEKKRRKMDSLLRQFKSNLQHGLLSPLFAPDADQLEREADVLAPKAEADLARIGTTQAIAQKNLAQYLAADHLDVYVATSMRSDADFVSVNEFVTTLFQHDDIRPLKLRYFNPTQSWIEDRVAKGLVEALMLRRAGYTIYMAQKEDTFGKDSEASVALGQGKPVIVYVPKLDIPEVNIDTEILGRMSREELRSWIAREGNSEDKEIDETVDHQALLSRLLEIRLSRATGDVLPETARRCWADFDLYGEAGRIDNESERATYRKWLDETIKGNRRDEPPGDVRTQFIRILIAMAIRFERRAGIFREVHPLALQVILSSGVLNGILVVRSVGACATILRALITNSLELELKVDENNYRLVEKLTGSTIRVISRHKLIANAFSTFYRRPPAAV